MEEALSDGGIRSGVKLTALHVTKEIIQRVMATLPGFISGGLVSGIVANRIIHVPVRWVRLVLRMVLWMGRRLVILLWHVATVRCTGKGAQLAFEIMRRCSFTSVFFFFFSLHLDGEERRRIDTNGYDIDTKKNLREGKISRLLWGPMLTLNIPFGGG